MKMSLFREYVAQCMKVGITERERIDQDYSAAVSVTKFAESRCMVMNQ